MHQVGVILDKLGQTAEELFVAIAQWYLLDTPLQLFLCQLLWLVLTQLVPSKSQVDKSAILFDDEEKLSEDGWSQALPADIELTQSFRFLHVLAKLIKRSFAVMHIDKSEVADFTAFNHRVEKEL